MDTEAWTRILHELGIIIAAVSAAIAAASSLKNGRTLNGHKTAMREEAGRKEKRSRARKKTSNVDGKEKQEEWYTPPVL